MTDQKQPQYQPGTVVNGHVLTNDGRWIRVSGPAPGATPPKRKMSRWAKLGIVLATIFVLFVGCVAIVANVADDATTEPDTAASSPAEGVEQKPAQEDNPAVSQGIGAKDASGDVELGQAKHGEFGTVTVPVKITNRSEKRSDYWITVAADNPDGSRITTTWVAVSHLDPGQTTEQPGEFFQDLPDDAVFKVVEVQRTASV
jgi:hypothetical protein